MCYIMPSWNPMLVGKGLDWAISPTFFSFIIAWKRLFLSYLICVSSLLCFFFHAQEWLHMVFRAFLPGKWNNLPGFYKPCTQYWRCCISFWTIIIYIVQYKCSIANTISCFLHLPPFWSTNTKGDSKDTVLWVIGPQSQLQSTHSACQLLLV